MNKRITTRSIRTGIEAAKRHGLRVKTGWIYGLPGTLDEQYESISFMRQIRPHEISIHQLIPFPGTEYYNHPESYGIRIRDRKDFRSFCYGGLGENISFDYLSLAEYLKLLEDTVAALEADGYVSSDRAGPGDEYVFTTPLFASRWWSSGMAKKQQTTFPRHTAPHRRPVNRSGLWICRRGRQSLSRGRLRTLSAAISRDADASVRDHSGPGKASRIFSGEVRTLLAAEVLLVEDLLA